ncbi:MucBP domain-containing protein [Enterococcus faecalis]
MKFNSLNKKIMSGFLIVFGAGLLSVEESFADELRGNSEEIVIGQRYNGYIKSGVVVKNENEYYLEIEPTFEPNAQEGVLSEPIEFEEEQVISIPSKDIDPNSLNELKNMTSNEYMDIEVTDGVINLNGIRESGIDFKIFHVSSDITNNVKIEIKLSKEYVADEIVPFEGDPLVSVLYHVKNVEMNLNYFDEIGVGVFPSDDTALKAELDITGFQKAVNSISPVDMDSFEVHMNNSGIKESYLNSLGYNKTQYEGYDFVGYKRYISVEVDGVKQYKEVPLDTPLNNLLVGNYIVGVYQKKVENEKQIHIRYVDEDGQEVSPNETLQGKLGEPYNTSAKEIPEWKLKDIPKNATGIFTESMQEIVYVYEREKNDGLIKVNYVDEDGQEVSPNETLQGKLGEPYNTSAKEIPEWKLKDIPKNATGIFTESMQEVVYVYEREKSLVTKIDYTFSSYGDETIEEKTFQVNTNNLIYNNGVHTLTNKSLGKKLPQTGENKKNKYLSILGLVVISFSGIVLINKFN